MRFRTIMGLTTLFLICFTVAVWTEPLPAKSTNASTAPENQSVSGKIASIGDASFEVAVTKANQNPQTVQFLVDDQTRVEGKLTIGAQAQVEYRSDSGRNIAVHVIVTPSSGVSRY